MDFQPSFCSNHVNVCKHTKEQGTHNKYILLRAKFYMYNNPNINGQEWKKTLP